MRATLCLTALAAIQLITMAKLQANPATPPGTPAGQETLVQRTYQVLPLGDKALLASTVGIITVDLKDPAKPRYLGVLPLGGSVNAMALVGGDRLAVALGQDGVVLADISDLKSPRKLSRIRLSGAAMGLAVSAGRLLVASGTGGLQVLDIKDPAAPRKIAHRDTAGYAREVVASGEMVYVADGRKGLALFKLDPNKGRLWPSGRLPLKGSARALAMTGKRLMVACATAGVAVLDLSSPLKLRPMAWLPVKDTARGVSAHHSLVAVADGTAGVALFDVSDAASPRATCHHKPRRSVNRVVLARDLALVANDHDGLLVLRVRPGCVQGGQGKAEVLGRIPGAR